MMYFGGVGRMLYHFPEIIIKCTEEPLVLNEEIVSSY